MLPKMVFPAKRTNRFRFDILFISIKLILIQLFYQTIFLKSRPQTVVVFPLQPYYTNTERQPLCSDMKPFDTLPWLPTTRDHQATKFPN